MFCIRQSHVELDVKAKPDSSSSLYMLLQYFLILYLHQNQNCDSESMIPKSCMKGNTSRGQIDEECGNEFLEDEPFKRSRIGSRAESRSESRCNQRDDEDFIEWTPKKTVYEKVNLGNTAASVSLLQDCLNYRSQSKARKTSTRSARASPTEP